MGFENKRESGRPVKIKDEGLTLVSNVSSINITGDGVVATSIGDDITQNIPGTGTNDWLFNGNTLGSKKTIGSIDNQDFGIITNNLERVTVLKDGKVGIGTNSPGTKLDVDGEIKVKTLTISPDVSGRIFTMNDREGTMKSSFNAYTNGVQWSIAGSYPIWFRTDGASSYIMSGLGIGTTAPNEQLEITKNFRLPATSGTTPYGIIYKDGSPFIHDFNYGDNGTVTTTGRNTFVGINAGNFAMGSTATSANEASYNTGIGYLSLYSNTTGYYNTANGTYSLNSNTTGYYNTANGSRSLFYNTTGYYNTAIGYQSLYYNTTGYQNTANGMQSLYSNTTGYNNTANGVVSLRSNTTGSNNTANGYYSLYSNTTGSFNTANGYASLLSNTTGANNTALGYNSGRYIANGTTGRSTGNNGIYLGFNSMASADGTNNEIVIGANAVGKGSSTAIIGNESLTALYVSGQVIPATLSSEPTGIEGGIYFNTTDKHFYGYNGTDWKQLDN